MENVIVTAGVRVRDLDVAGHSFPMNLRINQMQVTEQVPHFVDHLFAHIDSTLTLKQKPSGNILIGGGWRGEGDHQRNRKFVSYTSMLSNVGLAARVIPALRDIHIIRSWAGFDGRTDSQLPVLGPLPELPGCFVSLSCFGGYVVGPLVGRILADLVLRGKTPYEIEPFSPAAHITGPLTGLTPAYSSK